MRLRFGREVITELVLMEEEDASVEEASIDAADVDTRSNSREV